MPFLNQLRSRGHLPQGQEFCSLTPDITRFIVRQHEKGQRDSNSDGNYGTVVPILKDIHKSGHPAR